MLLKQRPLLLEALAQVLIPQPPSISHALSLLNTTDDYAWFRNTVQELLPEQAKEILAIANPGKQMDAFVAAFSEEHFPLDEGWIDGFYDQTDEHSIWALLKQGIPCILLGFDDEDLHNIWESWGPAMGSMLLLAREPDYYYAGAVPRIAWFEEASFHLPRETLDRVPRNGIPLQDLEQALQGTPLQGVADAASWVYCNTDNGILNVSPFGEEFYGFCDPWTHDSVQIIRKEWQKAEALTQRVNTIQEWLKEDLKGRFPQVLDFTLERVGHLPHNQGRQSAGGPEHKQ